jgi:hypothetical protein
MSASDKCYQLAQALYLMSTSIPYEDVQIAANQITQCTSNVLTVRILQYSGLYQMIF